MHVITRSGVLFLWMHMLTLVTSQDCTLQQFLNGPLFDSNFDTSGLEASYPGGKQVRVSCNVGYSGFFKLLCTEGKWQSRSTPCQPRSCGHPGDAQFADFHLEKGDDFVFGSQVVYTCQKGYQMVSRINFRRCMAQGWDGVVPVCEAQQCPVIHVDDNIQVIGDPEEATYGNVVRFSCKSKAEILTGLAEMYCDENGEWNGKPPKCEAVKCLVPMIENGYVPGDIQEYKEHDVLHFRCNPTYTNNEARPTKCMKQGQRADWSPTPLCEPIRCKLTLPPLEGTRYEPASINVFTPGDTLSVFCGQRHWIRTPQESSTVITCTGTGDWSIEPVCQEVTCINRRPAFVQSWEVYWGQQIRLGHSVRYWCRTGYKKTGGASHATCTRDGWNPDPLCEEIRCRTHHVQNADIDGIDQQEYRNNDKVAYVCKEGYKGRFSLTCRANGWIGTPQCTMVTCRTQYYQNSDIDGIDQWEYRYNDKVAYVCKEGYEGRFSLTCGANGWIGTPQCTSRKCTKLHIENAHITGNEMLTYTYNDKVRYACKYNAQRVFTVTCEQRGWTGIQTCPACTDPDIPHGFAVGPYNDTLYYTCEEGYKLSTKGWWAKANCIDGVWSGLEQCIENKTCGEIPVIPNGRTTLLRGQGDTARIVCEEGYTRQVSHLNCREGKWHSNGFSLQTICIPSANPCNPPSKVENAVVETPYQKEYLSGSTVTYRCRDKYTAMNGEDTILCQNGTWEEKEIKCTPYCDKLEDATLYFTADKEKYMDGEVIMYQCFSTGVEGNATCGNSTWNKSEACDGKKLYRTAPTQ